VTALLASLQVPSCSITLLVGKGGSQIKEMMLRSGAMIQINKRQEGGGQAVAVVTGPQAEVNAAKAIIHDIVTNDPQAGVRETRAQKTAPFSSAHRAASLFFIPSPCRRVQPGRIGTDLPFFAVPGSQGGGGRSRPRTDLNYSNQQEGDIIEVIQVSVDWEC
jgi:hypothetical protein